jgi:hypothetical protein
MSNARIDSQVNGYFDQRWGRPAAFPDNPHYMIGYNAAADGRTWGEVTIVRPIVPAPIAGDAPEISRVFVVCDCEHPHFVGAQKSCRGLDGKNATGIFAN